MDGRLGWPFGRRHLRFDRLSGQPARIDPPSRHSASPPLEAGREPGGDRARLGANHVSAVLVGSFQPNVGVDDHLAQAGNRGEPAAKRACWSACPRTDHELGLEPGGPRRAIQS